MPLWKKRAFTRNKRDLFNTGTNRCNVFKIEGDSINRSNPPNTGQRQHNVNVYVDLSLIKLPGMRDHCFKGLTEPNIYSAKLSPSTYLKKQVSLLRLIFLICFLTHVLGESNPMYLLIYMVNSNHEYTLHLSHCQIHKIRTRVSVRQVEPVIFKPL